MTQVGAVYIAVSHKSQDAASIEWTLFDGDDRIEDHPWYDILSQPNDALSGSQLLEGTYAWLEMRGRAFWLLDAFAGSPRLPRRIRLLDPDRMEPKVEDDEIQHWKYRTKTGSPKTLSPDEVIRFALFDHRDAFGGLAPLTAARLGYDLSWKSTEFQRRFYGNGGFPPFYVKIPPEAGNIGPEEREKLRIEFRQRYLGLKNAWSPPFLFKGATLEAISINQRDAEWIATQKLTREDILAIFAVPKVVAGYKDEGSLALADKELRQYWGGTIPGRVRLVFGILQKRLIEVYTPGLAAKPDIQAKLMEVMPEEVRASVGAAKMLMEMGVPPATAFQFLGLPVDTDGKAWLDEGYLPFSLVPVSDLDEQPPADEPPDDEADEERTGRRRASNWPRSEKLRAALWRGYEVSLRKLERRYIGDWRGFLRWVRDRIHDRLRDAASRGATAGRFLAIDALVRQDGPDELVPPMSAIDAEAAKRTAASSEASARAGWEALTAELELDDLAFNTLDPRVIQLLNERVMAVKAAASHVEEKYRAALIEGIQKGESIEKLTDRVSRVYREQYAGQARVLARTETSAAFSAARNEAMFTAGISRHEWLSARDDRVRPSHETADGEVVSLGEPFSNGLRHPLEWGGPPEETVQCRCVALPVVSERGLR